jgi:hypothetical protein
MPLNSEHGSVAESGRSAERDELRRFTFSSPTLLLWVEAPAAVGSGSVLVRKDDRKRESADEN